VTRRRRLLSFVLLLSSLACAIVTLRLVSEGRADSTIGFGAAMASLETVLLGTVVGLRLPQELRWLVGLLVPAVALSFIWLVNLKLRLSP